MKRALRKDEIERSRVTALMQHVEGNRDILRPESLAASYALPINKVLEVIKQCGGVMWLAPTN